LPPLGSKIDQRRVIDGVRRGTVPALKITQDNSLDQDRRELDWTNLLFMAAAHVLAGIGIWWAIVRFNTWTIGLALTWLVLCSLAITAGYHRLFAHRSYRAAGWVRVSALLLGAASVQNSALHWVNNHRLHHSKVDRDGDPYGIQRGFFSAHIGWLFYRDRDRVFGRVRDLQFDRFVMWQHRNYVALAVSLGALLPMAIASTWGDPLGGLLIAGFLRLIMQYHATFATNSVAHTLGARPYDLRTSARDHFVTALFTFGEGYHNYHHRFENDYRNGVRPWHFDPTKWLIFALSCVGAARDLRRTPADKVEGARRLARAAPSL
jgi:stearoyl-CoA desaturase (delta-9 desaturase)